MTMLFSKESSASEKHSCNVSIITAVGNNIISGSDDGVLKLWSPDLKLISEVDTKCGAILSLVVGVNEIYTCTSDETLQTWDCKTLHNICQIKTSLFMPLKLFYEAETNVLWAGDSHGRVSTFTLLTFHDRSIGVSDVALWYLEIIISKHKLIFYRRIIYSRQSDPYTDCIVTWWWNLIPKPVNSPSIKIGLVLRVGKFIDKKEVNKFELTEEIWDLFVIANPTIIFTARDRDVLISEIVEGNLRSNAVVKATVSGRYPLLVEKDHMLCLQREGRNIQVHENSIESKYKLIREITASTLIINALCMTSSKSVWAGGYDGVASLWNLENGQSLGSTTIGCCINAFTKAEKGVYAALSDGRIVLVQNT